MNIRLTVRRPHEMKTTGDGIDVWLAFLDAPDSRFEGMLSPDERQRAGRFHFQSDRDRFIARRAILRILLGCYLGIEPESVRFSRGEKGKPVITGITNRELLHFNLSHSENMAIYAFSPDHEVGVDIEQMRDNIEMTRLVERFFSDREKEEWRTLPESQRREAFFSGWTRKEAFTKATGDGLTMPLDSFDVSLAPGEPARLLGINGEAEAALKWTMRDLRPAADFAAALAVEGNPCTVNLHRWAS